MAILSVIEFFDESGEIIVCRMPPEGSGEYRIGSQLVVQESQLAVFYRDGQALDAFRPGRHTLSTENLPLLGKLVGLPFGGKSPFRCHVYFVSTKTFVNLGWGTQSPVNFRDTDFRIIRLRAHGSYSLRITGPRVFLNTIVGTRGLETTYALDEYLRSLIVARLNEVLGTRMKSMLDLPVLYGQLALAVKDAVRADFDQYGIELVDLVIEAITPPPEVQDMINRASGIAVQDADRYRTIAAADAMRDAANRPSGLAGEGAAAGVGLGVGLGIAQQFARGMAEVPSRPEPTSPATEGEPPTGDIVARLRRLKSLLEEGLITPTDFDEHKRRILSLM